MKPESKGRGAVSGDGHPSFDFSCVKEAVESIAKKEASTRITLVLLASLAAAIPIPTVDRGLKPRKKSLRRRRSAITKLLKETPPDIDAEIRRCLAKGYLASDEQSQPVTKPEKGLCRV
ncbi:PREDICTED: uncharacterized protein LOC104801469 [Tarenaya hassleriana]|uniref:uncharacterized protein LOC104801469 n=1 Tax=Tarenaya hassleriana TaxID=28532 RepID=UPI00053C6FCC|nr:PREDICTED: uncharacterized protein LOC104801469 [Tarenaya hassleriana]